MPYNPVDPSDDLDWLRRASEHDAQVGAAWEWINESSAADAADMIRRWPNLSPDTVIAATMSQLPPDHPMLNQIAEMERATQQSWVEKYIWAPLKWTTRTATAGIESVYNSSALTRGARFGVGLYQGMSASEAYEQSRGSMLYEMQRANLAGEDYTLGEGFFPTPQEPTEIPQYREAYLAEVQRQKTAGLTEEQVNYQLAHAAGIAASPVDVTQRAIEGAERIQIQSHRGGPTVPVSIGSLLSVGVLRPGTPAYSIVSGLLDFPIRVGADPFNVPAWELEMALRARRVAIPSLGRSVSSVDAIDTHMPAVSPVTVGEHSFASVDQFAATYNRLADAELAGTATDTDRSLLEAIRAEMRDPDTPIGQVWSSVVARQYQAPPIPPLSMDPAVEAMSERLGLGLPDPMIFTVDDPGVVDMVDFTQILATPPEEYAPPELINIVRQRIRDHFDLVDAVDEDRPVDFDVRLLFNDLLEGSVDSGGGVEGAWTFEEIGGALEYLTRYGQAGLNLETNSFARLPYGREWEDAVWRWVNEVDAARRRNPAATRFTPEEVELSKAWRINQITTQLDANLGSLIAGNLDPVAPLGDDWVANQALLHARAERAEAMSEAFTRSVYDEVLREVAQGLMEVHMPGTLGALQSYGEDLASVDPMVLFDYLYSNTGFDPGEYYQVVARRLARWREQIAHDAVLVDQVLSTARSLARQMGKGDDAAEIAGITNDLMTMRGRGIRAGVSGAPTEYESVILSGLRSERKAGKLRGELGDMATRGFLPSRRPWVNPRTGREVLDSRRGRDLVNWVAANDDVQQLVKYFGNLDDDTLRRLLVTNGPEEARRILLEQWGYGIRQVPRVPGRVTRNLPQTARALAGLRELNEEEVETLTRLLGAQRSLDGNQVDELRRLAAQRGGTEIPAGDTVKVRMSQESLDAGRVDLPSATVAHRSRLPFDMARRRWLAGGGSALIELDPTDRVGTIAKVGALLDTAGVELETKDAILRRILFAPDDLAGFLPVERDVISALERSLVTNFGYTREDAARVFDEWRKRRAQQENFQIDAAGRPIALIGGGEYRMAGGVGPDEGVFYSMDPIRESMFDQRHVLLPSVTDVRRATSKGRAAWDAWRRWIIPKATAVAKTPKIPGNEVFRLGLERSYIRTKLNQAMSVWRAAALWRVAWPLKIVFDELARMAAAGYADEMTPFGMIGLIAGRGDAGLIGGSLRQQVEAWGALGTGIRVDPKTLSPIYGSVFDTSFGNWHAVATNTTQGRRALWGELVNMNSSVIARMVAQRGVDGALEYFSTPAGMEQLRTMVAMATPDQVMAGIEDPARLRRILEANEAAIVQASGGRYVYRTKVPGRTEPELSEWRYHTGQPLPQNRIEVLDELEMRVGTEEVTRLDQLADDQLYAEAYSHGVVHPSRLEHLGTTDQQFVILDPGLAKVRRLIANGIDRGRPPDDSRWALIASIVDGTKTFDYHYYPKPAGEVSGLGPYHYRVADITDNWELAVGRAGPNGHIVIIPNDQAGPALRKAAKNNWEYVDLDAEPRQISVAGLGQYDEFSARPVSEPEHIDHIYFDSDMTVNDHQTMAERLEEWYGYHGDEDPEFIATPDAISRMPAMVRAPIAPGEEITAGRKFSDAVYYLFGELPTNTLARHPMLVMTYWREVARYGLYVGPEGRATLRQAALEAGISGAQWDDLIRSGLRESGMRALPEGRLALDIDTIHEAAGQHAAERVRDLLYDLTKTGNIADAARLLVPFGDAWWEVITRWTEIMHPTRNPRAALNYRRVIQAMMEVDQSGWFSTDRYGNEVFNWPGFMPLGPTAAVAATLDPRSALFVDPANPSSLILPGTGPLVQLPTSWLQPLLPPGVRDSVNWLVYGDFPAPERDIQGQVNALLPTPYKRIVQTLFSAEMQAEFGDEVSRIVQVLLASGEYDPYSTEDMVAASQAARSAATALTWGRLIASVVVPGSVRFEPSIKLVNDWKAGELGPEWMTAAAAYQEWRSALSVLGSQERAYAYFIERMGHDPLALAPATTRVLERPMTKGAWDWMKARPDLERYAPFTLAAFLPEIEGDEFFLPALQEALEQETQTVVTENMVPYMLRVTTGYMAARRQRELFDEAEAKAIAMYGEGSDALANWRKEAAQLERANTLTIQNQYFGGATSGEVPLEVAPPSYAVLLGELRKIGTPGSAENQALGDELPEYVDFLEKMTAMMNQAEQRVDEYNAREGTAYQASWWRSTQYGPESVGGDPHLADQLKDWFTQNLAVLVTQIEDPQAQGAALWAIDKVIAPLLTGMEDESQWLPDLAEPPEVQPDSSVLYRTPTTVATP